MELSFKSVNYSIRKRNYLYTLIIAYSLVTSNWLLWNSLIYSISDMIDVLPVIIDLRWIFNFMIGLLLLIPVSYYGYGEFQDIKSVKNFIKRFIWWFFNSIAYLLVLDTVIYPLVMGFNPIISGGEISFFVKILIPTVIYMFDWKYHLNMI